MKDRETMTEREKNIKIEKEEHLFGWSLLPGLRIKIKRRNEIFKKNKLDDILLISSYCVSITSN